MTRAQQKSQERQYVEKAAELLEQIWQIDENWWAERKESPDFLVEIGHDLVGLEVVKIFKDNNDFVGSEQKRSESINAKRLMKLEQQYEEKTGTKLYLRVGGKLSNDFYEQILPMLYSKNYENRDFGYRDSFELECGNSVQITVGANNGWISISDRVGWVGKINEAEVLTVIQEKAKKLEKYRKNCTLENIRLLIVSDRILNSGKMAFKDSYEIDLMGFEKIYLLSYPEQAIELPPSTAP